MSHGAVIMTLPDQLPDMKCLGEDPGDGGSLLYLRMGSVAGTRLYIRQTPSWQHVRLQTDLYLFSFIKGIASQGRDPLTFYTG